MIYVYKQSPIPLQPWDVLRRGGVNNIAPEVKARYLLLWNADILQRDGIYHYIFEFDTRDTLKKSGLAQITQAPGKAANYPDGMDWRAWLSQGAPAPAADVAPAGDLAPDAGEPEAAGALETLPGWQIITADVRWEILHMPRAEGSAGKDVVITGLRALPSGGNGGGIAPRALPARAESDRALARPQGARRYYQQSRLFDDENLLLALPMGA